MALDDEDLRARVGETRWYHTIELAPGLITPGYFDTRDAAGKVPMPASLDGLRCLDVGTYDGFWAFEMERRGASEVVAIDVLDPDRWDWPAASLAETRAAMGDPKKRSGGFDLAREALGSKVERRDLSVYELDPAEVGVFDFVYVGSLLLHLRDPIAALERVRAVCTGKALVVDAVDPALNRRVRGRPAASLDGLGRPWWWKPNVAGLARMVESAGFELIEPPRSLRIRFGEGGARPRLPLRQLYTAAGREVAGLALRGDPHAAALTRPAM